MNYQQHQSTGQQVKNDEAEEHLTFADLVKRWQQEGYKPDRFDWQRNRAPESLEGEEVRGGAAAAASTAKRRQFKEILEEMAPWLDNNEEEMDSQTCKAVESLCKGFEKWVSKPPPKKDAIDMLNGVLKNLKGEDKAAKKGGVPNEQRRQTFYQKYAKKETPQAGKGGGKGKKDREKEEIPKFDLQRSFPRSKIVPIQMVLQSLERGEVPDGQATICRDACQMCEVQDMVKALEMDLNMLLFSKHTTIGAQAKGAKECWLPYVGNIAMTKGCVATATGKAPTFQGEKVTEVKEAKNDASGQCIRVTIALNYLPAKSKLRIQEHPEEFLRLLQLKDAAIKTYRWTKDSETISGYAMPNEKQREELMQKSGQYGIFTTFLSRDVVKKDEVTWLPREADEENATYHARVQKRAEEAKVAMVYRRGGGADLGIKVKDGEAFKAFAIWGVGPQMGPQQLEKILKEQGWELNGPPQESRRAKAPWRINGKGPKTDWNYQLPGGRMMTIVPWQAGRKQKDETERLCGRRWFNPDAPIDDPIEEELSPTLRFTPAIAATQIDTPESETQKSGTEEGSGEPEPIPKRRRAEKHSQLVGGMQGPDPGTHLLNCGGDGDCGWRCASVLLAMRNSSWKADLNPIAEKAEQLAKALRGQGVSYLLNKNTEWQAIWQPDERATEATEDGKIAETLEEFKACLHRPRRWICELGLQSIADLKQVAIPIFEKLLEVTGWRRIKLILPASIDRMPKADRTAKARKLPIVPMALSAGHYFAIMRESRVYPTEWLDEINTTEQKAKFSRGGGEAQDQQSFYTPKKKGKDDDISYLLRTCSSKHSSKKTEDKDIALAERLLRTCTPVRSAKTKAEDKETALTERLLRTCTPLRSAEKPAAKPQWHCPLCSFKCEIDQKAAWVIKHHVIKLHAEQQRRMIKQNKKKGITVRYSGIGLRKLVKPVPFETIKEEDKKEAWFICEYCKKGVKNRPQQARLILKTRKHHLKNCPKRPKNPPSLTSYCGVGTYPRSRPIPFVTLKGKDKETAWFICGYCKKGVVERPEKEIIRWKTGRRHLMNCPQRPKKLPKIRSYIAYGLFPRVGSVAEKNKIQKRKGKTHKSGEKSKQQGAKARASKQE